MPRDTVTLEDLHAMADITDYEAAQLEQTNATGRTTRTMSRKVNTWRPRGSSGLIRPATENDWHGAPPTTRSAMPARSSLPIGAGS